MNLLRCATHSVVDLDAAKARFGQWLDYAVVEEGTVPADLAAAWGAPASAGRRYAVMQPASGAEVFLRFVEGDPVSDYLPIRSYGWAAIEICVQDVLAVNDRMLSPQAPFPVIGPPTKIAGIDTIYPMQVRGPDQETLYFTQILTDAPDSGLPRAGSLIDKLFILVLACPDMRATADWFARTLKLDMTSPMAIRYSMISLAFGLPISDLHEIVTAKYQGDVFLEFDQYPQGTVSRPAHEGALPPGVSICTLFHPDFDALDADWFTAPVVRDGPLYAGRRVGVLKTPEGALLEVMEG
ncbi:VOC family protein [Sphingobium sp. CR2-8]|uniref:VOC family protein n=1 Tax=Sphingobium sp. CR2-8 TaxID=1306534 RepID=UPI002DBFF2FB|nr:VOC family protein [Sphingobium sp. CR2-8]MEC3911445.1 VOC family protein [Sphingobium sp. CR2-8]